ncbi:MAG TPA: M15 family metallopeptidase [bacterium]|nr:M15 family metallopeptidase [bacterium]
MENAMAAEGFIPLHEEWWHFDAPEWENYPVLDINPYDENYFI